MVAIALEALFIGQRSPSQTRGIFCLAVGYLALLIMDEDSSVELNHSEFLGCVVFNDFHLFQPKLIVTKAD